MQHRARFGHFSGAGEREQKKIKVESSTAQAFPVAQGQEQHPSSLWGGTEATHARGVVQGFGGFLSAQGAHREFGCLYKQGEWGSPQAAAREGQ